MKFVAFLNIKTKLLQNIKNPKKYIKTHFKILNYCCCWLFIYIKQNQKIKQKNTIIKKRKS